MKRRWLIFVAALTLVFSIQSCSDEDNIAASLQGTREQSEGELAPFLLEQNYPNPFNPSTAIFFNLSQSMRVSLKVYTEDWQEVQTILDGQFTGGPHRVTFNAKDLPSGEYYYTLEGGGYTQIRKMKLVK